MALNNLPCSWSLDLSPSITSQMQTHTCTEVLLVAALDSWPLFQPTPGPWVNLVAELEHPMPQTQLAEPSDSATSSPKPCAPLILLQLVLIATALQFFSLFESGPRPIHSSISLVGPLSVLPDTGTGHGQTQTRKTCVMRQGLGRCSAVPIELLWPMPLGLPMFVSEHKDWFIKQPYTLPGWTQLGELWICLSGHCGLFRDHFHSSYTNKRTWK